MVYAGKRPPYRGISARTLGTWNAVALCRNLVRSICYSIPFPSIPAIPSIPCIWPSLSANCYSLSASNTLTFSKI